MKETDGEVQTTSLINHACPTASNLDSQRRRCGAHTFDFNIGVLENPHEKQLGESRTNSDTHILQKVVGGIQCQC